MNASYTLTLSLLGGVVPALLWLWFWLKEDRLHPEPKVKVAAAFLAGVAAVFIVLPIERFIFDSLVGNMGTITVFLWASTEEIFKFIFVYLVAFRNKDMDEPIDAVMYMITGALGFSAIENAMFLWNLIDAQMFTQSIITGNMRFLGATLLHTASSATIGIMYGLAFYKRHSIRNIFLYIGIILSIALHTIFNLLIINRADEIFFIFSGIWVLITILIVLIEKVKTVHS